MPEALVRADTTAPVALLVACTSIFGTTAPVGSSTRPVIVALVFCARAPIASAIAMQSAVRTVFWNIVLVSRRLRCAAVWSDQLSVACGGAAVDDGAVFPSTVF